MGTHSWTPSTPGAFNTNAANRPTPHVEMLIAPSPLRLLYYDNTRPFNHQLDIEIPKLSLDVMAVREDILVRELGQPLEHQFHVVDDGVSVHWVVYITDWVNISSPLAGVQPGMEPKALFNDQGDVVTGERVHKRIPVGCLKMRPVWSEVS